MTTTRYNGVAVVSSTECTVGFKITIESLYNAPDISDFYIALFSNISEAQRDEHMQILQQTCASDDSLRFTRVYSTRFGDDRVINYHRDIITGGVAVARAGTRATIRATPKTVNITTIEVYPNRKCVIDTYKPRPPCSCEYTNASFCDECDDQFCSSESYYVVVHGVFLCA